MPDAGDTGEDRDALQTGAVPEGSLTDAGDTLRDRDDRQVEAVSEGPIPDTGDTLTNRDARQAGAVSEGRRSDTGYRPVLNILRNNELPRGLFLTTSYCYGVSIDLMH